jgi:G3E family GTPase
VAREGRPTVIPVDVLTGFLGSGKTTVLRRLLTAPLLADAAVLINEFGDVGIDHLLVERLDDDVVLLQAGCICCTIRGDLAQAIRDLHARRARGVIPRFNRLVIETTGLADPAPILSTVLHEPMLRHQFTLGRVITTVDGVTGLADLARHPETAMQVAVADRLVITKRDLAPPGSYVALHAALAALNPVAPIVVTSHGAVDVDDLLGEGVINDVTRAVAPWRDHGDHAHDRSRHRDIRACCLTLDRPIAWDAFAVWLTMLLNRHGGDLLRFKGVLDVAEADGPVVVQGVQHAVYPPEHLAAWPFADRCSRLVVIGRRLDEAMLRRSLDVFQALGAAA